MADKVKSKGNNIRLNVPYKSQLDNKYNPLGACNVTSLAMVIEFFDPNAGDVRFPQLEDYIYRLMENHDLNRHYPQDLVRVVQEFFYLKDDFTAYGTLDLLRKYQVLACCNDKYRS